MSIRTENQQLEIPEMEPSGAGTSGDGSPAIPLSDLSTRTESQRPESPGRGPAGAGPSQDHSPGAASLFTHPTVTCSCTCEAQVSTRKRLYREFLRYYFPVLLSIAASVFAILSLLASWRALKVEKKANSWAYLSYNSSLVQIRLSLMQLCVDNPGLYNATCGLVHTWNYLPSVYDVYHPDGVQHAPTVPSPEHSGLSETNVAITCFAVVLGAVPLVATAVLATGHFQRGGSKEGVSN